MANAEDESAHNGCEPRNELETHLEPSRPEKFGDVDAHAELKHGEPYGDHEHSARARVRRAFVIVPLLVHLDEEVPEYTCAIGSNDPPRNGVRFLEDPVVDVRRYEEEECAKRIPLPVEWIAVPPFGYSRPRLSPPRGSEDPQVQEAPRPLVHFVLAHGSLLPLCFMPPLAPRP